MQLYPSLIPVSYTHLVQKAIDLSGLGLDTIEETDTEFIIGAMVTLRELELHSALNDYFENAIRDAAVSYTHLDVYKRQGPEHKQEAQKPVELKF